MLYLDLPTLDQLKRLTQTRSDACVSIYLETTPLSQHTEASRIELGNLVKEALRQLAEAGVAKARIEAIREPLDELGRDYEFWRFQANSLALLSTPDQLLTFRLANRLSSQVEVSDRFHLKPLLRAITFPHAAFVLALSAGSARLVEIPPSGPLAEVRVQDMPSDASEELGIRDREPKRRIQRFDEQKKTPLIQYARKVEAALRPVLAGGRVPFFLAATEPMLSIYRSVNSYPELVPEPILGNPEDSTDAELATAARAGLDQIHASHVAEFRSLFETRAKEHRTTTDVAQAARAATFGAIDTLLVDIDVSLPGTVDETTGAVTFAGEPGRHSYGVVDEIAARALVSGARVMAVRKADIPGGTDLAAILRYPF